MTEKGICQKHGEFILDEGCPQCLAEGAIPEIIIVCNGGCGRTTEGMTFETRQGEFEQVDESGVPKWTCPDCGTKKSQQPEPAPETALALRPGEDIEARGYFEEAQKLLEYAESRVIATLEDNKAATDDLSIIAKLKKAMDNKRKSLLDPLKLQSDAIRETYDYLMAPIRQADNITREKMLAYTREQDRIRQEQEEINRKRQEAAEAEMRLKGELTEPVNLVEVSPEVKRVSTEMGTSGVAKIWKFEVIDFSLLPDRFKMENATLIGKVVRAGEREIPGVKIWSEDTLRVTAR